MSVALHAHRSALVFIDCRRYFLAKSALYKHSEEYLLMKSKKVSDGQVNVERQLKKRRYGEVLDLLLWVFLNSQYRISGS